MSPGTLSGAELATVRHVVLAIRVSHAASLPIAIDSALHPYSSTMRVYARSARRWQAVRGLFVQH
jgi:hypothetical protein